MKLYKFVFTAVVAMPSSMKPEDLEGSGKILSNCLEKNALHNILLEEIKTEMELVNETTLS